MFLVLPCVRHGARAEGKINHYKTQSSCAVADTGSSYPLNNHRERLKPLVVGSLLTRTGHHVLYLGTNRPLRRLCRVHVSPGLVWYCEVCELRREISRT